MEINIKQAKQELTEKYKEIQQYLFSLNSEILLVFDEFKEVLAKFEKQNNCKVVMENCPLYQNSQEDIQNWQNCINELLENPIVDNYFDYANELDNYFDFMIDDAKLTASTMSPKQSKDLIEYQYNQLDTFIKKNKIVLDKIDALIENINSIKD